MLRRLIRGVSDSNIPWTFRNHKRKPQIPPVVIQIANQNTIVRQLHTSEPSIMENEKEKQQQKRSSISAESSGIFTPTLNMMGWQQNALDEYLQEFVDKVSTKKRPIADLGAAYGFVTKKLLENGNSVVINDLDERHIKDIPETLPEKQKPNLKLMPGNFLELEIESESLDGIVAARLLQFLTVDDIRKSFELFHKWLTTDGLLCVTNSSPYRGTNEDFVKDYERKKKEGVEWPGITTTDSLDKNRQKRIVVPQTGYRFDPEIARREAEKVGFSVMKCSFYSTPFLPDEFRSPDGKRDGIGLLAIKK